MAHGYYKVEGKPIAVLCHGTVGLQHATMAVYNAYCDRVPVFILAGNHLDAADRGYPESVVSDEELGHIHAYLQSRPMPPPVKSIPLLQP